MKRGLIVLVTTALLLWPALLYQSAGYLWDTSGYYRGGRVAVQFAANKLSHHPAPARAATGAPGKSAAATSPASGPANGVGGLRSLVYSVAAYVLAPGGDVLPLVIAQTILIALTLAIMVQAVRPVPPPGWIVAAALMLAATTTLPVFATLATPDLFAGLLILCTVTLVWFGDRLGSSERLTLVVLAALSVSVHASHVALGGVILALALAATISGALRRRWRDRMGRWRWAVGGVALGLAANALLGMVGFGEVSVAPKHFPFALARSIEDGPAFWYLQDECPRHRWAVCEVYRNGTMPRGNYEFLWGTNGIATRATPVQMDRIRTQEPMIVRAAVIRYPWFQIRATLTNIGRQIMMVGIDPASFQVVKLDRQGDAIYRPMPGTPSLPWLVAVQRLGIGIALLVIAAGLWRGSARLGGTALLVLLLLLANDAICGGISAPEIRYQNRALWLLPLVALTMLWEAAGGRWRPLPRWTRGAPAPAG